MRAVGALALAGLLLAGAVAPSSAGRFQRSVHAGQLYRLYVPAAAQPAIGTSRPLIVALHGCGQTAEDFAAGTRLNESAEPRGAVVLYPVQGRTANASRCWNWFDGGSRRRGEVARLLALIGHVAAEHPIDRERVVALGFSAGAFMAVNLACVAPDIVRGVGLAAGGPFHCGLGVAGALECMRGHQVDGDRAAEACRTAMGPAQPARASLWHGANDPVVSPANLQALARMFTLLQGPLTSATERLDGASRTIFRDARGRARVETWLVKGMGHAWSGGDARGTHTFPAGPPATARMLDFLLSPE